MEVEETVEKDVDLLLSATSTIIFASERIDSIAFSPHRRMVTTSAQSKFPGAHIMRQKALSTAGRSSHPGPPYTRPSYGQLVAITLGMHHLKQSVRPPCTVRIHFTD